MARGMSALQSSAAAERCLNSSSHLSGDNGHSPYPDPAGVAGRRRPPPVRAGLRPVTTLSLRREMLAGGAGGDAAAA